MNATPAQTRLPSPTVPSAAAICVEQDALWESTARPRLAFVGVGWIGRNRLKAVADSGIANIVCVADACRDAAQQCQQSMELNACAVCESLDEALEQHPDGVVIATPSALHAQQAIAALQRGIAVFCQKPLARTASETRQVIEAARAADRLLGVDLSYRHLQASSALRQVIQSGQLGDVFAAELVFHNAYGPDKPWFYDRALSGGGCVIDLGIHMVDLALWMLNAPKVDHVTSRLYARGCPLRDASQVEDYAIARIDLASGATLQLSCSWNLPAGREAVIAATFYGTMGGASLQNVNGSFYDFTAQQFRGTHAHTLVTPPDQWQGRAIVHWTQQLCHSPTYDPSIESLLPVMDVLDQMYGRMP